MFSAQHPIQQSEIIEFFSDNDTPSEDPHLSLYLKDGYEIERFVDKPREEFKCVICFGIVRSPRECQVCGLLLCNKCSLKCYRKQYPLDRGSKLHNEFNCPICRTSKPTRIPSKMLVTILESLRIKCKYFLEGCTVEDSLRDIKSHESRCEFKSIKCANYKLCLKKGEASEFMTAFEGEKKIFLCSEICEKVEIMKELISSGDKEGAKKMFLQELRLKESSEYINGNVWEEVRLSDRYEDGDIFDYGFE